jgi:hypothetical protein
MKWLIIFCLLTSCSAEWHLNQAIKKNPTLKDGKDVVYDTTIVTQTKILNDTLRLYKDTTIYQDKVILDIKYLPGERIAIKATCPPDTIRITKTIKPHTKYVRPSYGYLWLLIPTFVLAIALFRRLR